MTDLSQPHDRFFSSVFSRLETAEDILISNIPPLADRIVPGTIEDCKEKLLNPELKQYVSDLLLKAKLHNGKDAYIYLLLEHKSYHEPQVAFHLLRYMVRIWEEVQEESSSTPLPFIFPVVIYHGKRKWKTDTHFASLVDIPPGLEEYVPPFRFYLYDLSQYSDQEIQGTILSRVSLLLFKHIFDEDFGERFVQLCGLLKQLNDHKTALEYLRSALEYAINASDKIAQDQVHEGIQTALSQTGADIMPTLAEQFREEGRIKGREEGHQQGLKAGIQLALELKFGKDGLAFYQQIQDHASGELFTRIEQTIRSGGSLQELEQLWQNMQ